MNKKLTKGAIADFVRTQLKTNEKWAKKALLEIYKFQTESEQQSGHTEIWNNVGFNGCDDEILTSLAQQLIRKGWLSPKQMVLVHKKIQKYTRQVVEISDKEKLENLVLMAR